MGIIKGAQEWWAKKQSEDEKKEREKKAEEEEQKRLRFNLEELLDQYMMKDLKDICSNYLGIEPPVEKLEDKKTGKFREIKPDRRTYVNFILGYYDNGELKASQIKDFSTKRKIVAKSFFGEESEQAGDEGEFRSIINSIRDEFTAENILNEQHLEDQLMIHLRAKFPNKKIERQQQSPADERVDILIEGKYVLELKVPKSKNDLMGLAQQLKEYKRSFPYVCAVIADITREEEIKLAQHIKHYTEEYMADYSVPSIVKDVIMR